jgi:hypothetical protein
MSEPPETMETHKEVKSHTLARVFYHLEHQCLHKMCPFSFGGEGLYADRAMQTQTSISQA